jgi:hypothetical protein
MRSTVTDLSATVISLTATETSLTATVTYLVTLMTSVVIVVRVSDIVAPSVFTKIALSLVTIAKVCAGLGQIAAIAAV